MKGGKDAQFKVISAKIKQHGRGCRLVDVVFAKGARGEAGVLSKEIDEVGAFFEAQAPGDFTDIPAGMPQE
jgi:hypothetical protein